MKFSIPMYHILFFGYSFSQSNLIQFFSIVVTIIAEISRVFSRFLPARSPHKHKGLNSGNQLKRATRQSMNFLFRIPILLVMMQICGNTIAAFHCSQWTLITKIVPILFFLWKAHQEIGPCDSMSMYVCGYVDIEYINP